VARQLLALRRASWSRSRQLPGAERTLTPRSFDDDPAMGFNKRKMEDRRRKAAEHEAVARRALGPQIIEDSVKLIEAWNARQAAHMPMLFSPTIEAAITAGYWFLRARCPACRTTGGVWPFWAVWAKCLWWMMRRAQCFCDSASPFWARPKVLGSSPRRRFGSPFGAGDGARWRIVHPHPPHAARRALSPTARKREDWPLELGL
jgi:hypothetical protein